MNLPRRPLPLLYKLCSKYYHLNSCLKTEHKELSLSKTSVTSDVPNSNRKGCVVGCMKRQRYRVRRAIPSDTENVIEHIRTNFFQEEPVMKALGLSGPNNIYERLILQNLREGTSHIAETKNPSNNELVGVCIAAGFSPLDCEFTRLLEKSVEDPGTKKFLQFITYIKQVPRLHELYGDMKIWDMSILSVSNEHRGNKLGNKLARESLVLGRNMGYRFSRFDSTNAFSASLASKLGSKPVWEMPYKDYVNYYNEPMFYVEAPHTGVTVFVENLRSPKIQEFEDTIQKENEET